MFGRMFEGFARFFPVAARALLVLAAIAALSSLAPPARAAVTYVVSDAETGSILLAHRANRQHPPASLTKMMTLYLTFEALQSGRLKAGQRLLISRRAARQRPSRLGLKAGRTITVKNAILAMATKSANDAAVVIAEALAGSEHQFAKLMTRKARQLGMSRTTFRNASGLPRRGQISTARDMAVLARALIMDYPQHYYVFATRWFRYGGRRYRNHNKLLASYPGVDGIKTGYTRASRFNVAISAVRGGHRVIAVVFGDRSARRRDRRARRLLNQVYGPRAPHRRARPKRASFGKHTPPAGPEATSRPRAGRPGWGIQVGAYRDYWKALRRARWTLAHLPRRFSRSVLVVSAAGNGRRPIYRARIYGLTARGAREACAILGRKRLACMPLTPSGVTG